ncbi:MAG: FAD-dependent oxidoreductase [Cuspidothrix sp.]
MVFNSQETLNPEKIYDVVIVGSGPIGLATAVGLYKRGIQNILVLDQTRTFRPIGKGLDLLPNGLKSLKYLDINAYTTVKEFVISLSPQKSLNSSRSWCSRNPGLFHSKI